MNKILKQMEMQLLKQHKLPNEALQAYLLAGQATVGIHSQTSGDTFWFWIKERPGPVWQVFLHYSVHAELDKYIGFVVKSSKNSMQSHSYHLPKGNERWSVLKKEYSDVFAFAWRHILANRVPDKLHFYHDGRCGYCGRPLTDPESMIRGVGPVCLKNLGL